jgi:hypothetical protein
MRVSMLAFLTGACLLGPVVSTPGANSQKPIDQLTVYLHYRGTVDREVVDAVADVLRSFDYHVADERLVTQPTAGDVRFFFEDDRKAALHVKALAESVLATKGYGEPLELLDRRGRIPTAWPGLIELWLPPRLETASGPPHRPREHTPAGEEAHAADRRDRAEPARAGER